MYLQKKKKKPGIFPWKIILIPILLSFLSIPYEKVLLKAKSLEKLNVKWITKSGIWKGITLTNGNKVVKQIFDYDRKKNEVPTPYLIYRTIQPRGINESQKCGKSSFTFNIETLYAKNKEGEIAVFLGGENEKRLYFIRLLFNSKKIYNASLQNTSIIDLSKPLNAFGNFTVSQISEKLIDINLESPKQILAIHNEKGIEFLLNNEKIFEFKKPENSQWTFLPKCFFAFGSRGAIVWLDDVVLSDIDGNTDKIVFSDDFTNTTIGRIRIK